MWMYAYVCLVLELMYMYGGPSCRLVAAHSSRVSYGAKVIDWFWLILSFGLTSESDFDWSTLTMTTLQSASSNRKKGAQRKRNQKENPDQRWLAMCHETGARPRLLLYDSPIRSTSLWLSPLQGTVRLQSNTLYLSTLYTSPTDSVETETVRRCSGCVFRFTGAPFLKTALRPERCLFWCSDLSDDFDLVTCALAISQALKTRPRPD